MASDDEALTIDRQVAQLGQKAPHLKNVLEAYFVAQLSDRDVAKKMRINRRTYLNFRVVAITEIARNLNA